MELEKFSYDNKIVKMFAIATILWGVVGMLVGFLTDGDSLFNYPGAFTFCFLLPVFCLSLKDRSVIVEEL